MRKTNFSLLLIIITFLSFTCYAQEVKLVKDINTILNPNLGLTPLQLTIYNNKLYFSGTDAINGVELWESDGTIAGTKLVKDIYTGLGGGQPKNFVVYNNKLYFQANDGINGIELWESDGTDAGTKIVKDIRTGSNGSEPGNLVVYNNKLYFTATEAINGTELWESDGTDAGTKIVKDINPGTASSSSSSSKLTIYNNKLFFSATDGVNGVELWESNGTLAGTVLMKNIYTGSSSSDPQNFEVFNNKLYFTATDGTNGQELWESDGTVAGTKLLIDIEAGSSSSTPQNLIVYNSKLYFQATDAVNGAELWESNGTVVGTQLVKDIQSGAGSSNPSVLTIYNNKLYFSANDGTNGIELFESDGTGAGTKIVKDIRIGHNGSPSYLTAYNNKLYFQANDGVHGAELWESDGTEAGTKLVNDFYTATNSSAPSHLTFYNNKLYFSANEPVFGAELWESDGTEAGTKIVKDIYPGANSSPQHLAVYNNKLYFNASSPGNGAELWVTDGTEAGTKLVKDIYSGSSSSFPRFLKVTNGKLYFTANNGTNGYELWESDGTESGTKLVKDIRAGNSSSSINNMDVYNNKLYFDADNGTAGRELWESDGTDAGTKMVKNINTGGSSYPQNFKVYNNKLYFRATDGTNGNELWESDGTAAGTKIVKNILSGSGGSTPQYLTVYNNKLYFQANGGTNGQELWESDGTDAGTKLVKDIRSGSISSNPLNFNVFNNKLYFQANDGTHGVELWESDGTDAGTKLVKDLITGSQGSYPSSLITYNNKLYFQSNNLSYGTELFSYEDLPSTITTKSPEDNATGVGISSNFVIAFNEDVAKGTGNIVIYNAADDSVVETIDVTTAKVSVSGKVVTINPATDLEKSKSYYIQIAATAIKDNSDNNFAGITDKITYNFTTELKVASTINFADFNKTYGGATVTLAATSNGSGTISYSIVAGGTGTATLSGTNNAIFTLGNAGTVKVKATQVIDENYLQTEKEITVSITKAALTITADTGLSKVYGATDPVLTYVITGFVNGDTAASLDTGVSITRTVGENVGDYAITPSAAVDANYSISFVPKDFSISKAAITITADTGLSKVYGATDPALTYFITGFVNGDTAASLDTGVSITRAVGENVGDYAVTPSAAVDANYSISFVPKDFSITKAALTITADSGLTKVYGATDPTLTYVITGFVNGDTAASLDTGVSITRTVGENVGDYAVTPSAAVDANYSISFEPKDFSITKAALTITANTGLTKVYGATDPVLTYVITGFVNGDTAASLDTGVSIARTVGENVGDYAITPSTAVDVNYSISFVPKDFSITKAVLTITANTGLAKVYGATDPVLTYVITGFVNGDTAASLDTGVSITRTVGENVGDYAITPSTAADANYSISFVPKDFSITKATQVLTFGALTHSTNDVFDLIATSTSGLEVEYSSSDLAIVTIIGKTVNVVSTGTVNITASQSGNSNYLAATNVVQPLIIQVLGLDDAALMGQINVYPNPVTNFLKIDLQNLKNVDIRIFDINGKLILSQKKYNSKESISISKFKKGIYLLEITKNNKRSLKKFIKQ